MKLFSRGRVGLAIASVVVLPILAVVVPTGLVNARPSAALSAKAKPAPTVTVTRTAQPKPAPTVTVTHTARPWIDVDVTAGAR